MMPSPTTTLLEQFESRAIIPTAFRHQDHLEVAFAMLDQYSFVEACTRYASTIEHMAKVAGAPEKFNATITFAFMSLIAERKSEQEYEGLSDFLTLNPDLLEKSVLGKWYSTERLTSKRAREQFLLPDKNYLTNDGGQYEQTAC